MYKANNISVLRIGNQFWVCSEGRFILACITFKRDGEKRYQLIYGDLYVWLDYKKDVIEEVEKIGAPEDFFTTEQIEQLQADGQDRTKISPENLNYSDSKTSLSEVLLLVISPVAIAVCFPMLIVLVLDELTTILRDKNNILLNYLAWGVKLAYWMFYAISLLECFIGVVLAGTGIALLGIVFLVVPLIRVCAKAISFIGAHEAIFTTILGWAILFFILGHFKNICVRISEEERRHGEHK